jgi:hypothetical protein
VDAPIDIHLCRGGFLEFFNITEGIGGRHVRIIDESIRNCDRKMTSA